MARVKRKNKWEKSGLEAESYLENYFKGLPSDAQAYLEQQEMTPEDYEPYSFLDLDNPEYSEEFLEHARNLLDCLPRDLYSSSIEGGRGNQHSIFDDAVSYLNIFFNVEDKEINYGCLIRNLK